MLSGNNDWYRWVPKWLRFTVFYGFFWVWAPISLGFFIMEIIWEVTAQKWKDFE